MRSLFAVIAVVLSLLPPRSAAAQELRISGSDTMQRLVAEWSREYDLRHGTKIRLAGGGSSVGIAALAEGTVDFALASERIGPLERERLRARFGGKEPLEIQVAWDGLAFYVHPENRISAMSLAEAASILRGEITDWREVCGDPGPVHLLTRDRRSGTRAHLEGTLLQDHPISLRAREMPGTAAIVRAVSRDPAAFGYGGGALAFGVKVLRIRVDGAEIAPTAEEIRSGRYPLRRPLYFYAPPEPGADSLAFVGWCLSAEGQATAARLGYFAL